MDTQKTTSSIPIVVAIILLGMAGFWWFNRPPTAPQDDVPGDQNGQQSTNSELTPEQFQSAVEAVAATEEADFERARPLWAELIELVPNAPEIQINQAVALLKWIDVIDRRLASTDAKLTDQERQKLLQDIEIAYEYSQDVTSELADLEQFNYRVPLIRSAILASQAARAQAQGAYEEETKLRLAAADTAADGFMLCKEAGQTEGLPLLAASLDEHMVVLAGAASDELRTSHMESMFAAWQAAPRNLYLLKRSAELFLQAKDPRLKELLQPSLDITRPMWSLLERHIGVLKPEELIPQTIAAIDAGDWSKTVSLRRWLNLVLSMPGFNPDSRRVKPDPLALLDTGFLLDVAPSTQPVTPAPIQEFRSLVSSNPTKSQCAIWYDFDFDLRYDVIAAQGQTLSFLKTETHQLVEHDTLELPFAPRGMLAADLFEVLTPDSLRLPKSVAQLMIENSSATGVAQPDGSTRFGSRHETLREILVWGKSGICFVTCDTADDPNFSISEATTGLEAIANVRDIVPSDLESDGDLDLLVISEGAIQIWQNNGNRTFQEITPYSTLPDASLDVTSAVACDFDQDMDQDFMLIGGTEPAVLENLQHGHLRYLSLASSTWSQQGRSLGLDFSDIDHNSSWDFVCVGPAGLSITSTTNSGPGRTAAKQTRHYKLAAEEVELGDFNNDGQLDLLAASSKGLHIASTANLDTQRVLTASSAQDIAVVDRNYDGSLDILALVDGVPTVFTSAKQTSGNYVDVRLAGINDINGGGRINHYGLGSRLQIWAGSQVFNRAVKQPVTHFGLGSAQPDNLRVVFTNGLTQNVEEVLPQTLVEEMQLLRGSCPYVYGWNGERFELITDLLWNAPLGLQLARGKTMPDRRWENILLPGELVQERNGKIELRITEELWEIAYFDHIQLSVFDHRSGTRAFTNEKVGPPQIAQHKLYAVAPRRKLKRAVDSHGRDITDRMARLDREYAQAFNTQICQGLCEPHFVELDFGQLTEDRSWKLFLTGWMYPTDTSLNVGISQNPSRHLPEAPSLWVADQDGQWLCRKPIMGFPGGKPKSIVVDLDDVLVSDDHRIRIGSSQQIYWDEAFVSWQEPENRPSATPLELVSATLHYRGFSAFLPRAPDKPHWFDYHQVSTAPNWPELEGPFTRYGDVRDQLTGDDDRMVVITSGDEIKLVFDAPPPLEPGWKRDFVLYSTGWDKDADINTIEGQGSLPLPFKEQRSYPAPPEQSKKAAQVWSANADSLTRSRMTTAPQSPN